MATNEEEWACSACTFANHPDLISCEICGTDRSENHQGSAATLSSQEQILKTAGLSVSSAPFIPKDSPSQQPEADKKALSVSSSPFDPSWRQRMWGPPALPSSTTKPTSTSTTTTTTTTTSIPSSTSARGNEAAMMPGVHHRPMNMMQGYGMMPPPVSMPVHGMPMMGIPGQVTYPSTTILVISVAMRPPLLSNTHSNLLSFNTLLKFPSVRWDTDIP